MRRLKQRIKRHWPRLRLRTILFVVLLFTAILPAIGTVFFRIYENALVRQTEAELVMQGAALAAAYASFWRAAAGRTVPADVPPREPVPFQSALDLSATPILPERPPSRPAETPAEAAARSAGEAMQPIVIETGADTLAAIRILDRQGITVAGPHDVGRSFADAVEVREALAGTAVSTLRRRSDYEARYAFEEFSRASAIRVHHARPVRVDGTVVGVVLLSRSPRSLFRGLYDDRAKIVLAGGAILLVVAALAGLLSRSITRPIGQLNAATRRVASGETALPAAGLPEVPPTAAGEIQDLFRNFHAMAETIEHRSAYIRRFAAAVSHEFKTPLTAIRGAIELLQEHGRDMAPAERERFLANAAADADRLSALVGRLLELARADVLTTAGESVDIGPLLDELAGQAAAAGIAVRVREAAPVLRVAVGREALETALLNLFSNSRQHGASRVEASISHEGASMVVLRVADDGRGIPAEDRERIFEPFFTTRRGSGGTGLGLPIARALLRAHGGDIRLEPSNAGAAFALVLPIAAPAG